MTRLLPRALAIAVLAWPAADALAQYKVVRPDGSVTYTDRPPLDTSVRVTPLGRSAAGTAEPALPAELRQPVQRYPVLLYTTADCLPCDNARRFLQQRGIPFGERRISSEEDALALEQAVGGRTVPALTIGAQPLRGMSETDWTAYLDAAGYPRESKLPRNWPTPQPQPMTERAAALPPAATPAPAPRPPAAPPAPGGLRF